MLPVDHVYVLNLDRRPEKWKQTKDQFDIYGIDAERFPAVDGLNNDIQEQFSSMPKTERIRNANMLACLLSHLNIIKDAIKNNYKSIAVFEDDVLLHRNFPSEIKRINKLKNWDLIYLGACQSKWEDVKVINGFYRPVNTLGAWAFLVNSRVFHSIKEQHERLETTADIGLVKLFSNHDKCYVASPNICISDTTISDLRTWSTWEKTCNLYQWKANNYYGQSY